MRTLFVILLAIHGLIHFMGFVKGFHIANIEQLSRSIGKGEGLLWLVTGLLFLAALAGLVMKWYGWWMVAAAAVVVSQILIMLAWQDAKWGTIANAIILLVALPAAFSFFFEKEYKKDVAAGLERTNQIEASRITEADLQHLPGPVKRYLEYVGVVGQPKVHNMRVILKGQMREKGQPWFDLRSEQYSFLDDPTRLYFLRARMKGLPVAGYHRYMGETASMRIKLLSLLPVVNEGGDTMFQSETVTYLNDLCLMTPGALIDERIHWEAIDSQRARAIFTNWGVTVSAVLHFNEEGQLVNFVSDDRYARTEEGMVRMQFSTPVGEYKNINGLMLPTQGEAIYHYPDGPFAYGKLRIKDVEYNVAK